MPVLRNPFLFAALYALCFTPTLLAQEAAFEDWRVTCSAEGEAASCHMQQALSATEDDDAFFFIVAHEAGAKHATAVVSLPLGVYLANGIEIHIPGRRVLKLPFEICDPTACHASFALNGAALSSFQRGTEARFRVWLERAKGVEFPVSLRGFTVAHAQLAARVRQ